MKRYLVENSGYVHMALTFIWFIPLMACFMVGTTIFNDAVWMPVCALVAIVLQITFAIVESDWKEQVLTRSGYHVDSNDEHYHHRPQNH